MDHGVCLRQVQPHPSCFQADQKQWHLTAGELVNERVSVFALPGEFDPRYTQLRQRFFDQTQHFGELRKQQNFASFSHHFGQHVQKLSQLGGFPDLTGGAQFQQSRVTADLTQFQQRIEDGDL